MDIELRERERGRERELTSAYVPAGGLQMCLRVSLVKEKTKE